MCLIASSSHFFVVFANSYPNGLAASPHTITVIAESVIPPLYVIQQSILSTSPFLSTYSSGIPCTTQSFTDRHKFAGNH